MNRSTIVAPELARGASLLDVGAGAGTNARALADAGFQVVAVEIDATLVGQFESGPEVRLVRADGTCLPLKDHAFDGAVTIEVLEHVHDPLGFLSEIRRVVRPGGAVTVAVPTGYSERLYSRLHPGYLANATHRSIFDRTGLEELLSAAGFRVQRIETANLGPAMAWTLHALARTRADHTGEVQEHRVLDRIAWRVEKLWSVHAPRSYAWMSGRVGKSWYAYCRA